MEKNIETIMLEDLERRFPKFKLMSMDQKGEIILKLMNKYLSVAEREIKKV